MTRTDGAWMPSGEMLMQSDVLSENLSGTMDVTKIEGERFWASFEITAVLSPGLGAEPDPAQAVNVTGTINNASIYAQVAAAYKSANERSFRILASGDVILGQAEVLGSG